MIHRLLIMLFNIGLSFNLVAQHPTFSMTSTKGNNTCHARGEDHTFDFRVTLPANHTQTQGDDVYKDTYRLVNNGGFGTVIHGENIYTNRIIGPFHHFKDFGTAKSGRFTALHPIDSRATELRFTITVQVLHTKTRTYTNVNGKRVTETLISGIDDYRRDFIFPGPPIFENTISISVDSTPVDTLFINTLDPCKVYTLTSNAVGETGYQWHLPDASWLISNTASLTTNSIDIRVDWSKVAPSFLEEVRLEAFQDCHTTTSRKDRILYIKRRNPIVVGSAICRNRTTIISVPQPAQGVVLSWVVDPTKVNIISGQGTNQLEVQTNNYHRAYTPIILNIISPCGNAVTNQDVWMGTPLPTANTLTGVSTAAPGNVRTFQGSSADGTISSYTWSIPSSGLQLQYCTDCWKLRGSGTTTNNDGEIEPFAHVQIGRTSGYVQALYENACGDAAAIQYVNVQTSGGPGGGGLCCDAPDPKIWSPNSNLIVSLDGQRTSYGFDLTPLDIDITTDLAAQTSSKVYPNPVSKMLHIELSDEDWSEKEAQIILYSLASGKQIKAVTNSKNTSLDVVSLPTGVYLLEINTATKIIQEKIVIQH